MHHVITDMTNKKFVSKLPNYTFTSILFRFVFVSLTALLSLYLIWSALRQGNEVPALRDYIITIIAFNVLSELNIVLDIMLERILPIPQFIRYRPKVQIFLSLILVVVVHQVSMLFFDFDTQAHKHAIYIVIATGLVFVTLMSSSLLIIRLMDKWYFMQKQVDKMKQEKLKNDYNVLQDQLNPHFLFNNLSVLKSLIIYDNEKAVNFTQNFTDVYRYVLRSKDLRTVSLEDELEFIRSYVNLHQERLGKGLDVKIEIDPEALKKKIPPLALQLLVENAIKHNIVTRTLPLHIDIIANKNQIIVRNNIQPKQGSYSTETGLKNLVNRYNMLNGDKVRITNDEEKFEVCAPLIDEDEQITKMI
ncbi:MAG: histidine kinase [Salinivirgaceae bacterium]|nr:MAG: histidine kinase [Salinivirgaceae bacterium]